MEPYYWKSRRWPSWSPVVPELWPLSGSPPAKSFKLRTLSRRCLPWTWETWTSFFCDALQHPSWRSHLLHPEGQQRSLQGQQRTMQSAQTWWTSWNPSCLREESLDHELEAGRPVDHPPPHVWTTRRRQSSPDLVNCSTPVKQHPHQRGTTPPWGLLWKSPHAKFRLHLVKPEAVWFPCMWPRQHRHLVAATTSPPSHHMHVWRSTN